MLDEQQKILYGLMRVLFCVNILLNNAVTWEKKANSQDGE